METDVQSQAISWSLYTGGPPSVAMHFLLPLHPAQFESHFIRWEGPLHSGQEITEPLPDEQA